MRNYNKWFIQLCQHPTKHWAIYKHTHRDREKGGTSGRERVCNTLLSNVVFADSVRVHLFVFCGGCKMCIHCSLIFSAHKNQFVTINAMPQFVKKSEQICTIKSIISAFYQLSGCAAQERAIWPFAHSVVSLRLAINTTTTNLRWKIALWWCTKSVIICSYYQMETRRKNRKFGK